MADNMSNLKKSPLYDYYVEKGLKLIDFGGWALPVQYTSQIDEHNAVRNSVGIFETSHMGEIFVTGKDAQSFLNGLVTNDMRDCAVNQAHYTPFIKEDGGTLDDLIIFRTGEEAYMVTPNGANKEKIFNWIKDHHDGEDVTIEDRSDEFGLIPVQGPNAQKVLAKITDADLDSIKSYHFLTKQTVAGVDNVIIGRNGYTGEDGFELYCPWDDTLTIWKALLEAGEEYDIAECGLGSRDTLRLEGGMCLYGQDLSEDINPIEGGVGFAVKTDKKDVDYIGKDKMIEERNGGQTRVSRGFEITGKGIARTGYEVFNKDDEKIGVVTSGTKSPTFGKAIGFIMIEKGSAKFGDEVYIQIRKKKSPAIVCKKDWLRRK